jgi:hypothetical protein
MSGHPRDTRGGNNHIDPDLAVEIFILQPAPDGRAREET